MSLHLEVLKKSRDIQININGIRMQCTVWVKKVWLYWDTLVGCILLKLSKRNRFRFNKTWLIWVHETLWSGKGLLYLGWSKQNAVNSSSSLGKSWTGFFLTTHSRYTCYGIENSKRKISNLLKYL